MSSDGKKIIVFDGECNYCNWAVNFIIKRDKERVFRFTPSQSSSGTKILLKYQIENIRDDSIILIENDEFKIMSDAVLEIFKYLGNGWKYMKYLNVFPKNLRDWGYSVFAKHRYSLFGKKGACMVPSEDVKQWFLN